VTVPTLPSGRTLALAKDHIPPAGVVTFKCPPGHYWFEQLDRKICPPPLEPGSEFLCDFVHAPCPKTRAEALAILRVLERIEPGGTEYRWAGYIAGEPEALADLTPEDRAEWDAWVASPKVGEFLDGVIEECKRQAEANAGNSGWMVFRE